MPRDFGRQMRQTKVMTAAVAKRPVAHEAHSIHPHPAQTVMAFGEEQLVAARVVGSFQCQICS